MSLPRNDIEFARAALDGGADAIKVHIAVDHFASGTRFGSWEEEMERIAEIVALAGERPVGLVPGGSAETVPDRLQRIAELGISFLSVYARHCPARWLDGTAPVAIGVAPDDTFDRALISHLPRTGISMLEASVIPRERYGTPLTAADLSIYHLIRYLVSLPIVLPSQLKWTPDDVPALAATGANALMIGAIVTGDTVGSVAEATKVFRRAIDRC